MALEIKYADNKRVVFEMNAIKICNRSSKNDLEGRIKSLEEKINNLGSVGLNQPANNLLNNSANKIEDSYGNFDDNYYNPEDFYKAEVSKNTKM